jgi:hypothetical protein
MASKASLSLQFSRLYQDPVDPTFVFDTDPATSGSDMNTYASSTSSSKYEGLISYSTSTKKVYVLKEDNGNWSWVELAQGTGNYQAASLNLTSLSGLTWSNGSPFIKMTSANTFTFDTNTYITTGTLSSYLTTSIAESTYLPIIAGTGSGSSNITLNFASSDSVFGSSTAVSGSITMNVTGAKLGVTHIVIHNGTNYSLSAGGSTLVKLTGSGNFKSGVTNYIYFTFIGNGTIIYSINQAA